MTTIADTTCAQTTQPERAASFNDHCRQLLLWLPLLPVAVGLAGGIVFDRFVPAPWGVYVAVFVLAGLLLLLASFKRHRAGPLAIVALVLSAAAVGGLRHQVAFWRVPADHVLNWLDNSREFARLRGHVVSEPLIRKPDPPAYSLPTSNKPRTSFLLAAERILTPDGWADCQGLVRVGVQGAASHIQVADAVEIYASLLPIEGPENPGQYDWQLYNRRSGLYVTAAVRQPESVLKVPPPPDSGTLDRLIGRFRQGCRRVLLDGIVADDPEAGLLATYVAGQRSAVNRQINEAFRRSGTSHLLAVSGSHVALIATVGGFLGWLLLRRPRRAALVAFAAVIFFSLLVEPNAPALRSAIMAILAVSGMLLNRPFNAGNWLSASAILLLLINPGDLFSPAFQMTFAAVISLILLTRAICTTLFGPRDLAGWLRLQIRIREGLSRWYRVRLNMRNALSYSVAAWLANFPLTIWHFGQFNPYGPIATVLITPLASLTLILGFCKMLLGFVSPTLGHALARPVELLAGGMARFADWLGSWPGASISLPSPPLWLLVLVYVALGTWAITARRRWYEAWPMEGRRGRSRPVAPPPPVPIHQGGSILVSEAAAAAIFRPVRSRYVVAATVALLGLYALTIRLTVPDHPRMHVLSVGDGLCVLVRSPGGQNLLYDCGSLTIAGVGEKVVVPALQSLGVRRIDAVVLSHANLDHYSGLPDLARAIPIRQVWLSGAFHQAAQQGMPRHLLQELASLHVPVSGAAPSTDQAAATSGQATQPQTQPTPPMAPRDNPTSRPVGDAARGVVIPDLGPITAEVLWPPAEGNLPVRDDNDASVVVQISFAGKKILLTGDIGQYAQSRLVQDDPQNIRADVLVLPHHGHVRTLSREFLPGVNPQVAVASTLNANPSNQVASSALSGCTVLDTHGCGMITIDLLPTGPCVTTFRPH